MRRIAVACATVALTMGLGACGGDEDDAVSGGGGTSTEQAATQGIGVEKRSIGIVNLTRQSPAEDKIDKLYERLGEELGWDVEIVDGAGDPQKIARAAQSFVNQNVDALITTSTEAAVLRGPLRDAERKDIPVISTNGGTAQSDLWTAQYEEDEVRMGRQLAQYIKEKQPDAMLGNLMTTLALSAVQRNDAFHEVFPKEQFAAEAQVDLTNPVANTEKTLSSMLRSDPQIDAVHAVYDNMAQAAVRTIERADSDANLYTYFTTDQNVANLKGDTPLTAVSDVDLPKTGAVAFDQLLGYFENDTPIDPKALETDELTYNIVDRDNIQELVGDQDSQYTVAEIIEPYLAKWAKEYPGS